MGIEKPDLPSESNDKSGIYVLIQAALKLLLGDIQQRAESKLRIMKREIKNELNTMVQSFSTRKQAGTYNVLQELKSPFIKNNSVDIVPYKDLETSLSFRINVLKPKLSTRTFKNLSELSVNPPFQAKVVGFLEDAFKVGKGKGIEIIDALRTVKEQRQNVARGVSKTMKSKHLEGKAIDIMYNGKYEIPIDIRQIAAKNGLWNGGDMWGWDYPHFQDAPSIRHNRKTTVLVRMSARGTNPNDYKKQNINLT